MKFQLQLSLIIILIILSLCYNNKIISFPDNVNEYKIKTNDGFILLKKSQDSEHNLNYLYLIGVKNLNKYTPPETKDISFFIYNDVVKFTIFDNNMNKLNPLLCDLFYQTNYINKKIYSVENDARNNPSKYFGGTPTELVENLNKFKFKNNEIPIFYLLRDNGAEKEELYETIIFNPQNELIYNEGFEKNCAKSIIEEWGSLFWEFDVIKYKFEESGTVITFRNEKLNENSGGSFKDIFYDYPCDNLVLGSKFLNLINVREFNLETGDVTLFTTDDNKIISNKLFN
jgi:hypothetical protein